MNSRYENNASMSLEDLVNMNAEATVPLDEVPYQPIVCAVPEAWLASWKNLLENAVRFQPTLYQQITPLATREEQENLRVKMRADVEVAKREVENSLKELREQDGKKKEDFYFVSLAAARWHIALTSGGGFLPRKMTCNFGILWYNRDTLERDETPLLGGGSA